MALGLLWAVLAAVATNIVMGMLWYGWLFKDPWMRSMGLDRLSEAEQEAMQKEAMPGYGMSMASAAVATVLLWFLFGWAGNMPEAYSDPLKGLVLGFTVWLGFYVGPTLTAEFFEDKRWTTWAIGAGYWGVLAILYGLYVGIFYMPK